MNSIISKDLRPIEIVWELSGESPGLWQVGFGGVTEIIVYDDNGEMAMIPWVAIYRGHEIITRIPARCVGIKYKDGGEHV